MSVTTTNGKAIADYDNYEDGKSSEQVQQFQASGVIPVAGKYSANGTMETKNVPLSDLLGGGSELPPIESGDTGKVLQVDGYSLVWGVVGDIDGVWTSKGLTGGGSAGTLTLEIDTAGASDGQVLTYHSDSDDVVWETPSSGSSGGYTPVMITPEQSQVSDTSLDVSVTNHTLVTLDLSHINPASVAGSYGLGHVNIKASAPAAGDYLDIMVQIKPFADTDGIEASAYLGDSAMPILKESSLSAYLNNRWICLHLIGNVCILTTEASGGE